MELFPWLLWLHIFGAIVAFGPIFAIPLIGGMGGKEPMHANFATRISARISHGITIPLAIVQGVTGLGLLLVSGRIGHLFEKANYWLDVAIVLYAIALYTSIFIQTPRVARIIEMTSTPPPPPSPGAAPSGPPPALFAEIKTSRLTDNGRTTPNGRHRPTGDPPDAARCQLRRRPPRAGPSRAPSRARSGRRR